MKKTVIRRLLGAYVGFSLLMGACGLVGPARNIPAAHADGPTPTPTDVPDCSSPGCGGGG